MEKALIADLRVFLTAPDGQNLVVVRVDTSIPGLYGLGCATLSYRAGAVRHVLEESLRPLLLGREAGRIEELWQLMYANAYWRGGPVLNNAVSGVDMALWDIKAKQAGMPLCELLGGRYRDRVPVYLHCNGADTDAVRELAARAVASGCRYLRVAYTGYDAPGRDGGYLCLAGHGKRYDPRAYRRNIAALLGLLRSEYGDTVELITDVHERLDPPCAVALAKELEPLALFFLEDPVPPEQMQWLGRLRQVCTTPIGMGELFCREEQCLQAMQNGWLDFIRCHLSALGGLTPARRVAALAQAFGVRTAWHGSLDMTPIALAVQTHLDLAIPSFGIQEYYGCSEAAAGIFPGAPEYRDGALHIREAPGHGVSFDEKLAAQYPPREGPTLWTEMRLADGGLHLP